MSRARPLMILLAVVAIAQLPPFAGTANAAAITIFSNLPFKDFTAVNGQPDSILLDVYKPGSAAPPTGYPAIVMIHGAFARGDKLTAATEATTLAKHGYVTITPNYRLVCDPTRPPPRVDPLLCGFHWPDPRDDVRDAEQWLITNANNANTYNVDVTRIGTFGTSAGAEIAQSLAVEDGGPPKPLAAVSLSGPSELWDFSDSPQQARLQYHNTALVGCDWPGDAACTKLWTDASPITWVSSDDSPMYLGDGEYDPIPAQGAVDMANAVQGRAFRGSSGSSRGSCTRATRNPTSSARAAPP